MEAIVFAVHDSGYRARSALELENSGEPRIQKIQDLIRECRYGIHDLSRTELDADTQLPRFNMPLELGIFLGMRHAGSARQKTKNCLVLDADRYRYQKFISDIAGQDIRAHEMVPARAVKAVRSWLRNQPTTSSSIPGGTRMTTRYMEFRALLPVMCTEAALDEDELEFNDYTTLLVEWPRANP
jgi:hypothetical protein